MVPLVGLLAVSTGVFALLWLLHPVVGLARRSGERRVQVRAGERKLVLRESPDAAAERLGIEAAVAPKDFKALLQALSELAGSEEAAEHARRFFDSAAGRGAAPAVTLIFPAPPGSQTLEFYARDPLRHLCYARLGEAGRPVAFPETLYRSVAEPLARRAEGTVGTLALPCHMTLPRALGERIAGLERPLSVTVVAAPRAHLLRQAANAERVERGIIQLDPRSLSVSLRLPRHRVLAQALAEALAREQKQVTARTLDAADDRGAVAELAQAVGRPAARLMDSLVLQLGDRARIVPTARLLERDEKGSERFVGIGIVGSALDDLLTDRGLLYFAHGHGERRITDDGPAGLTRAVAQVKGHGFQVSEADLARSNAIPTDCTVLVIAGPKRPFGKDAEKAIAGFLDRGGRLVLLLDPPRAEPVLTDLLGRYGIAAPKPRESLIASRPDIEPGLLLVHIDRSRPFAKDWHPGPAVFLTGCEIAVSDPAVEGMEALLLGRSLDPGAAPPPGLVAAAVPKKGKGPKLVVFGDVDAVANRVLDSPVAEANAPLLLDVLLWLAE
jgi:hypothetical protein